MSLLTCQTCARDRERGGESVCTHNNKGESSLPSGSPVGTVKVHCGFGPRRGDCCMWHGTARRSRAETKHSGGLCPKLNTVDSSHSHTQFEQFECQVEEGGGGLPLPDIIHSRSTCQQRLLCLDSCMRIRLFSLPIVAVGSLKSLLFAEQKIWLLLLSLSPSLPLSLSS